MKHLLQSMVLLLSLAAATTYAEHRGERGDDSRDGGRFDRTERNFDQNRFGNSPNNNSRRYRDDDVDVNIIVGPINNRRPYSAFNYGFNNRFNNRFNDRFDNRFNNNFSIFNTVGFGAGYSTFGGNVYLNHGYPYSPFGFRNNAPVIIERNTYIEQPAHSRAATTSHQRNSTSLLRDLQGRCYERVIDHNGNETRTELDASECDF